MKVRQDKRTVSVAVTIAMGVNSDGRREVLGMDISLSEAETFRTDFLRKLKRRGLKGVKLMIPDAHEGIKAAVSSRPSSLPPLPRTTPRRPGRNGGRSPTSSGPKCPNWPPCWTRLRMTCWPI